ncbi:MAG: efflux RND transporter periplasmic adaptor subunit [Gemmataceae bacterium]|nr:efflux RND transporter periplasmic adaptor subunit [Gemmataceae bacterium]
MRRTVLITTLALIVAIASALGFFWPFGERAQTLRLAGIVEIQEVRLGSKVGGRVQDVLVKEGQLVEPGTKLVVLEVPELEAERDQVQAKLDAATAEWHKAKAGPRIEEKESAKAAAAAALAKHQRMEAGWREEEKRQARAELEAAEADLKYAVDDFERTAELYRRGATARAEYEAALANRDRARARLNVARARDEMLQVGNRAEDRAMAKAEWEQAEWQYRMLKKGTRQEDIDSAKARVGELRAKLRELDVNLKERVVSAPEYAVVEVLTVRRGDLIPPNQPVARVLRAEDLWVKVFVPETELGKVRLNQEVDVLIDSYPGKRFRGRVTQVASISEFTPRNVQSVDERRHQVFGVKVTVPNPQGHFKAGMAAEVILPLHEAP